MKRFLALILTGVMIFGTAGCAKPAEPAPSAPAASEAAPASEAAASEAAPAAEKFHIGIVTGTVAQGEDEIRGAEAFIKEYGSVDDGGIVRHVTYPDNFMQEQETTIAQIAGLADDPLVKAIVVNQSIPGAVAAFKKVRELRPDILLLAGEPHEDPSMIEAAADLSVNVDNISRGYLMIAAAQKMGAKTFVHVSFPRHMSVELMSMRKTIMEEACKDLGMTFAFETAPDPMSDVGIPGAQQFILEKMPSWVEKYGKDTAFFCTNDAQTEPLLKRVAELGAIFVESDLPSPIMGYPGAFGIDLKAEAGDWPAILKKVEAAVVEKGGAKRMGTWAYSYGYTTTAGLAEFAKRVLEGTAKIDSMSDLMDSYSKYTPGAKWNGSYYKDPATNEERKNHIMVYQDTYVFGEGYLGMTDVKIPEKYSQLKNK